MHDIAPQPEQPDPGREALADALRLSFRLLVGVMFLLAAAYLLSGAFIVQEHERAYVLVFGRITGIGTERVKEPGLHWTWPKPIAEIVRVPAARIQNMEVNTHWYHEPPGPAMVEGQPPPAEALAPDRDGYLLTGDANILHARWGLRYTIRDPEIYLFDVTHPEHILQQELDRAVTRVGQEWRVDQALRSDIEGFRAAVNQQLIRRLDAHPIGMEVHRLDLLAIAPPRQVAAAFEAVTEAEQDRSQTVSAARADAARTVNEAQGAQSRIESESRAERQRIISEAEADADFFTSVFTQYQQHPELITQTLWQDRMRTVMGEVTEQYMVYEREDGQQEIRLQMGRPPEQ